MNRERIAAAALWAYPADTREAQGAEMLSTLLDASADSRLRFAWESGDLLRLGLRSRATRIAGVGPRRLIADGACLAGAFFLAQELATALHNRGVPHPLYTPVSIVVLAGLMAFALLGRDRVAGALALVWLGLRFLGVTARIDAVATPSTLLPIICFAMMIVSSRGGRRRSLLSGVYGREWLIVLVVLAGAFGGVFAILALASAVTFALLAGALIAIDPRPAIALALVAANIGITRTGSDRPALGIVALLAIAPVVLTAATARTRRLVTAGHDNP